MIASRRQILKLAGASALAGELLIPARAVTSGALTPSATSTTVASVQAFLGAHASPTFSLPPPMSPPPAISWAGPLGSYPVATSLPSGISYAASSAAIGGPIRNRFTPSLAGNPSIGGIPALAVNRAYSCKGAPRTVGSPNVLRFSTDAPVVEIAGVVVSGTRTSQTLIVNGQLVAPRVLSVCGTSGGGWSPVGVRINFGSRALRDIWLETGAYVAYVRLSSGDTLVAATDSADPQLTVVGDNYLLAGSNNFGNGAALALEIGARLGIRKVAVDSVSGSGYWNSGVNRGNLNDRIAAHAADNSSIYLVIAGLNDYADVIAPPQTVWPTTSQYQQAVNSYFQSLRAAQPNAIIAVTAPLCPNATLSDASWVQNSSVNASGVGDFAYKAQTQKNALAAIAGPWIWIDALMGGGWLNSSGASGGATGLQWLTGGTAAPGTSKTNRPGNYYGGAGGGFGGVASVPIVNAGAYTQAPDVLASGGSGTGLLLASTINSLGAINAISVVQPGTGYASGGLPTVTLDSTFAIRAGQPGVPVLYSGTNPNGSYPLQAFAPAGVPGGYSNGYVMLMPDLTNPAPTGIDYLASRLAQSLYDAVVAL
jgi:hypothetical protein